MDHQRKEQEPFEEQPAVQVPEAGLQSKIPEQVVPSAASTPNQPEKEKLLQATTQKDAALQPVKQTQDEQKLLEHQQAEPCQQESLPQADTKDAKDNTVGGSEGQPAVQVPEAGLRSKIPEQVVPSAASTPNQPEKEKLLQATTQKDAALQPVKQPQDEQKLLEHPQAEPCQQESLPQADTKDAKDNTVRGSEGQPAVQVPEAGLQSKIPEQVVPSAASTPNQPEKEKLLQATTQKDAALQPVKQTQDEQKLLEHQQAEPCQQESLPQADTKDAKDNTVGGSEGQPAVQVPEAGLQSKIPEQVVPSAASTPNQPEKEKLLQATTQKDAALQPVKQTQDEQKLLEHQQAEPCQQESLPQADTKDAKDNTVGGSEGQPAVQVPEAGLQSKIPEQVVPSAASTPNQPEKGCCCPKCETGQTLEEGWPATTCDTKVGLRDQAEGPA
eukprot:Skav208749  [mRNA]  locus=scaffold1871:53317:54642:+ [translate_table: standard]